MASCNTFYHFLTLTGFVKFSLITFDTHAIFQHNVESISLLFFSFEKFQLFYLNFTKQLV